MPILLPEMVLFSLLPIPTIPSSSSHLRLLSQNSQWSLCHHFFSLQSEQSFKLDLHGRKLFNGFLLPYDRVLYSLICFTRPFKNWFFHTFSPYIATLPFQYSAILNLFFSSLREKCFLRILYTLYLYRILTPPTNRSTALMSPQTSCPAGKCL